MSNFNHLFRQEIARLARKELRLQVEPLRKAVNAQRSEIARLKKELKTFERALKAQGRGARGRSAAPVADEGDDAQGSFRFSAKGFAANRKRLGLSAAEAAALLGTSGQSIYAWETGRAHPRARFHAAIQALRATGKRQVKAALQALNAKT